MADDDKDAAAGMARRRLLKLGAYAAPAVVGTLLLSGNAHAKGSCFPNGYCEPCSPCTPSCHPLCGPK